MKKKEKEKILFDSNDFDFVCAGVSNVVSYKRNARYNFSCLLQTDCRLSVIETVR